MNSEEGTESLEAFEERATRWIKSNLPSWQDPPVGDQELQQLLYDSGLAGIAFPQEYGGAGLTLEHQRRFFDTAYRLQRRVPQMYMVSIGMLGPTLLDHGSHEAKLRFLPPLFRGDEVWIQLLSEPRGGSDMAGAVTRLTKDGDSYILNGAKMWSTGALAADYGLCLCRSDWDMPKHRGLSTIAVPLSAETPGLTIQAIRTASGQPGETCRNSSTTSFFLLLTSSATRTRAGQWLRDSFFTSETPSAASVMDIWGPTARISSELVGPTTLRAFLIWRGNLARWVSNRRLVP